jgi:hypothetical protein
MRFNPTSAARTAEVGLAMGLTRCEAGPSSRSQHGRRSWSCLPSRSRSWLASRDGGLGEARASYSGLRMGTAVGRRFLRVFHEWPATRSNRWVRCIRLARTSRDAELFFKRLASVFGEHAADKVPRLTSRAAPQIASGCPNRNKPAGSGTPC